MDTNDLVKKNLSEKSVAAVFQNNVKAYGDKACVAYKRDGRYMDISWNEMNTMVTDLGNFLLAQGVKKGDRVAVFSPNRYEWWVSDLAILSTGAVNVPIYATNSPEEAHYVLQHSESKICFVATEDHLERVLKVKKKLPKLKLIVIFDELTHKKTGVMGIDEAYKKGASYKDKTMLKKRIKAIKSNDMATIIYTSGTTGNPKGVMLSHSNFISNVRQIYTDFHEYLSPDNIFLSFLPLSHSLERTAGYYMPMSGGMKVAFAEDFSKVAQNLAEIRPQFIVSVPRLYEKIHAGILAKVAEAPAIKQFLFNQANKTAHQNLPYVCNNLSRSGFFAKKYDLFDKVVFSKLKAALGMDRLRLCISGGGPLSVSDAEFFLGMGLVIIEGFGLTETTPVTNVNRPGIIKPGSVGPALPETQVKISDEGEILIKGPQVMMGYYKNPAATKEVFTKDGFFRTGDIGIIDEKGSLSITGRIKDIIVTAGGKNISPQNIENSVKGSKYVEQIAVIGDKRKYLSALVIPNFEEVKKWAKTKGMAFNSNAEMVTNEEVNKLIAGELDTYTKQFARVEQLRKFKLLDAEWTQETDELTPTLKVKRRVIEQKYASEIESLYPKDAGD